MALGGTSPASVTAQVPESAEVFAEGSRRHDVRDARLGWWQGFFAGATAVLFGLAAIGAVNWLLGLIGG